MKVDNWHGYGIRLISETEEEKRILKRFFRGGVKTNVIINSGDSLQLTFADLMEKDSEQKHINR